MLCAALLLAAADSQDVPAAPVLILMALGVLVAIGGHLDGSRTVVGIGIAILFLATAAMIVGGFVAFQGDEPRPAPARGAPVTGLLSGRGPACVNYPLPRHARGA